MLGVEVLVGLAAGLVSLGAAEFAVHRKRLNSISTRIHVNGTRGKSSVTRLIAAGLRRGRLTTCAKTTGTLARFIAPDGRELPLYRPRGANIIEQRRVVALAAELGADALVLECMALQPALQSLCELKLIRATHGVVTNARPDHLDVMGPGAADVARALAGITPVGGVMYTAEQEHLKIFEHAAKDRNTKLVAVEPLAPDDAALIPFAYTEHPDNVALALRVCQDLGVERELALDGMWYAQPDPGAMTTHQVDFFGRTLTFVNGFAANDPVSTEQIWSLALDKYCEMENKIAVFNCRVDRAERSLQLGRTYPDWPQADRVVLMGSGTYLFARAAVDAGLDPSKLLLLEGASTEDVFERIIELVERSALIMGMGNIASGGIQLTRFFSNRAVPKTTFDVADATPEGCADD